MARVLITGMSGTGKSTVLRRLAERGHRVVDTDHGPWCTELPTPDGHGVEQLWREDEMAALLADGPLTPSSRPLFVAGCAGNQGRFYDRFDAVVLLRLPVDVLLERLASRTTNDFGKDLAQRERVLADLAEVEPLLRATSTLELDARRPLTEVVDAVEALGLRAG